MMSVSSSSNKLSSTHLCYASFVSPEVLNMIDIPLKIFEFVHGGTKHHNLWYAVRRHVNPDPDVNCHTTIIIIIDDYN